MDMSATTAAAHPVNSTGISAPIGAGPPPAFNSDVPPSITPGTPPGMAFNPYQQILDQIRQLMQILQRYQSGTGSHGHFGFRPPNPDTYPPFKVPPITGTGLVHRGVQVGTLEAQPMKGSDMLVPFAARQTPIRVERTFGSFGDEQSAIERARQLSLQRGEPFAIVRSYEPGPQNDFPPAPLANSATASATGMPPMPYPHPSGGFRYHVVTLDPAITANNAQRVNQSSKNLSITHIVEGYDVRSTDKYNFPLLRGGLPIADISAAQDMSHVSPPAADPNDAGDEPPNAIA